MQLCKILSMSISYHIISYHTRYYNLRTLTLQCQLTDSVREDDLESAFLVSAIYTVISGQEQVKVPGEGVLNLLLVSFSPASS